MLIIMFIFGILMEMEVSVLRVLLLVGDMESELIIIDMKQEILMEMAKQT